MKYSKREVTKETGTKNRNGDKTEKPETDCEDSGSACQA